MDILSLVPDTHAGRHTRWLWSRMLAMAAGSPPPDPKELAEHFAPCVFEQVPAEELDARLARVAPFLPRVDRLVEETNSAARYCALLRLPDRWMRYTCIVQDDVPHLLVAAGYTQAMDPSCYSDKRLRRDGRDVQIRDFGGTGRLMLLWHGAGGDCASWETVVPLLGGFHVVAQDLPGHGRSPLKVFTTGDGLADADAVVAELDAGPPTIVGHSLGGYLGLRYAATRDCLGWIGLDGPLGIDYPWDLEAPGLSAESLRIGREICGIDVIRDLAALKCPAMLLLCAITGAPMEECIVPGRLKLAEHIARHQPWMRLEWVQTGHDMILLHQAQETAALIRDFLQRADDG